MYSFIAMNIFFLCLCVKKCAKYHFDKHVIKMILELCQLLCCAWHILDEDDAELLESDGVIYKKTHMNHPCAIWTRKHINNYNYVVNLALELCNEWRFRYNHPHNYKHKCETMLLFLKDNPPFSIPTYSITANCMNPLKFTLPIPQAMADEKLKCNPKEENVYNTITAYRNYYMSSYKAHLVSWTKYDVESKSRINLAKPEWFDNINHHFEKEILCSAVKSNGLRCTNKPKKNCNGKCGVHSNK